MKIDQVREVLSDAQLTNGRAYGVARQRIFYGSAMESLIANDPEVMLDENIEHLGSSMNGKSVSNFLIRAENGNQIGIDVTGPGDSTIADHLRRDYVSNRAGLNTYQSPSAARLSSILESVRLVGVWRCCDTVVRVHDEMIDGRRMVGSGHTYVGLELDQVVMRSCILAQFDDPEFGLIVRDCTVKDCVSVNSRVQGVYFDGVTVDGLVTQGIQRFFGCVFRHVVLKGEIGSLMLVLPHGGLAARERHISGMSKIYDAVDWALDISQASFLHASLVSVPGHLVRYDRETQVLLRREKFDGVDMSDLPNYASTWASRFSGLPFDSFVAVAPKRSHEFTASLRDIEWMRSQGLAD